MNNLNNLRARLDRIEEAMKPPELPRKWRIVQYFAPLNMPEAEAEAAEKAAIANEEAANGPILESENILVLVRIVNAPREQESTQAETAKGPPQMRCNGRSLARACTD